VATSQVGTPSLPSLQFRGPYSIAALEENLSEFRASIDSSLSDIHQLKELPAIWEGRALRQCADARPDSSVPTQPPGHMSQRSAASAPGPPHHADPSRYAARQTTTLPPLAGVPRAASPRERSPALVAPLPAAMQPDADPRAARSFKMHSILNPAGAADDPARPRPTPDISRASSVGTSHAPSESPPASSNGRLTPSFPGLSGYPFGFAPNGRPAMTAGPGGRGSGLGSINLPSGTIDARKSPFLSGQLVGYPDPGAGSSAGTPVGGSPPPMPRLSYGFPSQPGPAGQDRRSTDPAPTAAASQTNSPSTSYSSYSHLGHPSPSAQHYTIPPAHQPSPYYGPSPPGGGAGPQITLATDAPYGTVATAAGQSSYQLMTLDTDHGPIQVPVDVQAASKMADEKRKRNAGASARFRQRRKEKEREASGTIAKLEAQVRAIGEEREFYRIERDYFRSLVYGSAAQAQVVPRKASPRQQQPQPQQRSEPHPGHGHAGASPPPAEWQQRPGDERGGQDGRNTRRRISAYAPAYDMPAQHPAPAYAPSAYPYGEGQPLPPGAARPPGGAPPPPVYDRAWNAPS
jgi:hypothetical protein